MTAPLCFLLGRAPGPASVLHQVRAVLEAPLVVWDGTVPDARLLVLKDLPSEALDAVDRAGVATCNAAAADRASRDKAHVVQVLAEAGVPVPSSRLVHDWTEVRSARRPLVVKPRTGEQGDGVLLLDRPAPDVPVSQGPWLLQDRVHGDGLDRKLYVVGEQVLGVLRRWPAPEDRAGTPFTADAALREVALGAARALRLEVCGVDVVVSPDGPYVVDVNAFPGFKGVPGAADALVEHLRAAVPACA